MFEQMTSRERILAAIDHKPLDRIPTDYWGTAETTRKLLKAFDAQNEMELWKLLGVDKIIGVCPEYIGPELFQADMVMSDYWGVKYKPVTYANLEGTYMEMCHHPIAKFETIDEIEDEYCWPKADWFDFSGFYRSVSKFPQYAVESGYIAPFYMYTNIRGLEQTLIDLASDEEMADYIMGQICSFLYDYHQRLFEAGNGRIDIAQMTDDFGTQTGLMISLEMFDHYFKKHYIRFMKLIREHNIKAFHHDDGAIMPLIPRLVDIGIDILNPIQWHLPGMELEELKNQFGKQICFHGGIDNQYVLPFGSADEVKQEVIACMETLGRDGTGYILAPCHNVQVITPVDNIVSMYKTANEFNKFNGGN